MSMKLKSWGYQVLTAVDGSEAVSTVRREKPDLILLDIAFPPDVAHGGGVPWDGFRILDWLRRSEELKRIPVIFITGGDPSKYKPRALEAGAVSFFHKPYNTEELLKVIGQALGSEVENSCQKKRVLFVEDEADWRAVAGDYLEDAGFEVRTAKNIAEARSR